MKVQATSRRGDPEISDHCQTLDLMAQNPAETRMLAELYDFVLKGGHLGIENSTGRHFYTLSNKGLEKNENH